MTFLLGLVAGLILGWVVEWIIDWQFWRTEADEVANNERQLRADLKQAQGEITALQEQLSIQTVPVQSATVEVNHLEDLEDIDGIGSDFARRLRAAGIRSVSDLAAATPGELRTAIGADAWQTADTESWVAQAQINQLSKGK